VHDWSDSAGADHPLRPETNASLASPVVNALRAWDRSPVTVASVIPIVDEVRQRVVQVLHPWPTRDGPARWSEIAARVGVDRSALWPVASPSEYADAALEVSGGGAPRQGQLESHIASALVDDLASATATPDDVLFLIWNGWAGVPYNRWPDAAEVDLAHRPSVLLRGPLTGLTANLSDLDDPVPGRWGALLCWPVDRSWVMATEVDLPCTYVVGTPQLVEALLEDARLESGRTGPEALVTQVPD
jgi:hypothetical protein